MAIGQQDIINLIKTGSRIEKQWSHSYRNTTIGHRADASTMTHTNCLWQCDMQAALNIFYLLQSLH